MVLKLSFTVILVGLFSVISLTPTSASPLVQGQCSGSVCSSSYSVTPGTYWTITGIDLKNGKGLGPVGTANECEPCKRCGGKVQWGFAPPNSTDTYNIAKGFGGFTSGSGTATGIFNAAPTNCNTEGTTDTYTMNGGSSFTGNLSCGCGV